MTKNIFIKTVKKNNDKYIIFYSDRCPYSNDAIDLLKQKNIVFKGYNINNIEKINGSIKKIISYFIGNKSIDFNDNHKTIPIIFKYGKFLGGYTELCKDLNN